MTGCEDGTAWLGTGRKDRTVWLGTGCKDGEVLIGTGSEDGTIGMYEYVYFSYVVTTDFSLFNCTLA